MLIRLGDGNCLQGTNMESLDVIHDRPFQPCSQPARPSTPNMAASSWRSALRHTLMAKRTLTVPMTLLCCVKTARERSIME